MSKSDKTRREAIKTFGAAAAATVLSGTRFSRAADPGTVTCCVYGGKAVETMRTAIFEPFTKKTGIKVIEVTGPTAARAAAMVASGNIEWDIIAPDEADAIVLNERKMLETIDYSRIDKAQMAEFDASTIRPYAFPFTTFGYLIGWNTKKYSKDSAPKTWADIWDTKNFPGTRVMTSGTFSLPPIEPAVLADGVPIDKLYPLDLERAYRMLQKLKPHVAKWTTSAGMAGQALVSGEADLGMIPHGTGVTLMEDGAPLAYDFNQGLYVRESWCILKGSKNYDNAMKFIDFATKAEQQAAWAKLIPFGPTNKRAITLLTDERARKLINYPEYLPKMVAVNEDWWKQKDARTGKTNVERNLDMWNVFSRS